MTEIEETEETETEETVIEETEIEETEETETEETGTEETEIESVTIEGIMVLHTTLNTASLSTTSPLAAAGKTSKITSAKLEMSVFLTYAGHVTVMRSASWSSNTMRTCGKPSAVSIVRDSVAAPSILCVSTTDVEVVPGAIRRAAVEGPRAGVGHHAGAGVAVGRHGRVGVGRRGESRDQSRPLGGGHLSRLCTLGRSLLWDVWLHHQSHQ